MPNITGARRYVEVPAPEPRRGGLFPVARVIDSTDPHDLLGAEYQTDACSPASLWDGNCGTGFPTTPCNPTGDPQVKDFHGLSLVVGDPITVYDGIDCEWVGAPADHYESRVRAGLALKEQKAIEKHIETLIAAMATDITTGAPVSPGEAIGLLEEWLSENYEGAGLIHMSRKSATWACGGDWVGVGLDGTLSTCQGTPVANGAGYSPTDDYIAATGQITLLRGPVMVNSVPGMNVGVECVPPRVVAERTYVPLIECGAALVKVTKPFAALAAPIPA
jgi:hypothetical protein